MFGFSKLRLLLKAFEKLSLKELEMLDKESIVVNFTNILRAAFAPISFCQKNTNLIPK